MTLEPYSPEKLDLLALRLLDLAGIMREMANESREYGITDLALHDKKAQEWCTNLERWGRKSQGELKLKIADARAVRRVQSISGQ